MRSALTLDLVQEREATFRRLALTGNRHQLSRDHSIYSDEHTVQYRPFITPSILAKSQLLLLTQIPLALRNRCFDIRQAVYVVRVVKR